MIKLNGDKLKKGRSFFVPIIKRIAKNFEKAKTMPYGSTLKRLYVYGSYARKENKCGDIDILYSLNKTRLKEILELEKEKLFCGLSEFDFKDCDEYPDCMEGERGKPDCVKRGSCWSEDFGIGHFLDYQICTIVHNHLIVGLHRFEKEGTLHLASCHTVKAFFSSRNFDKALWKIERLSPKHVKSTKASRS